MKHIAKKRFGQNFLCNEFIINEIIRLINPTLEDFIVEIGPGLGALTTHLIGKTQKLHLIEIDRDLIEHLLQKFNTQAQIHNIDALQVNYQTLFNNVPIRVIGNLPYNISTPLLFHLAQFSNIKDMHFMLQKEVVERICAKPNTHNYGRLSVMLQYRFETDQLLNVSNNCFNPIPKVESAIVRLIPKPNLSGLNIDENKLNKVVTTAFNKRRKTIQNSLKTLITEGIFEKLQIDPKKRAENLNVEEYITLSHYLN